MAAAHNCEICRKVFSFKSKYERHLETQYHLDNVKILDYCESMDNVTSSYIEEPITATCSALSGVSSKATLMSMDGTNHFRQRLKQWHISSLIVLDQW